MVSEKSDLDRKVARSKEILEEAIERWQPHIGMACSWGKDSITLAHLIREIYGEIPVPALFTDTGRKFPETYAFRDRLVEEWGLDVVAVEPDHTLEPCPADECRMWKVAAARETPAKLGWNAIIVGIRHDEHDARSKEVPFSPREDGVTRVHPILDWTEADIWAYMRANDVPYNPLYDQGYRSIGCQACTIPSPGGAERSGRAEEKEEIMDRLRGWGYW